MQTAVEFQEQFLCRQLWEKQRDICNAIEGSPKSVVAIKGCHGSGKTHVVSGIVPWWVMSDPEAIALWIAPTLRQVKLGWNEINTALDAMPARFPDRSTVRWSLSEHNYALGFSAAKGVNAQGFHGKRVLIIEDESIGIPADVHDAIEGVKMAGDVRIIRMCNPTVPEGAAYEDFTRMRAQTECITISAFDTPNLKGLNLEKLLALSDAELDIAPVPFLTRRRAVKDLYYKWGPNNPRFVSRVLGEFPAQASDAVFQLAWIEKASLPYDLDEMMAQVRKAPRPFVQVGIDVAGPGDDETSAAARVGPYVLAIDAWAKPDPLDNVILFLSAIHNALPGVPVVVVGDTVGIGYHFMRAIARRGYDVRAFVAGGAAVDPVMFQNAKAEAYWRLREHMRDGGVYGIEDEDTRAQLSDVRYRELMNGKIEIEHKDEARARGSSSPDRAEALIMAFTKIVPRETIQTFGGAGSYQISSV